MCSLHKTISGHLDLFHKKLTEWLFQLVYVHRTIYKIERLKYNCQYKEEMEMIFRNSFQQTRQFQFVYSESASLLAIAATGRV